jgi:hypothetical protein
MNARFSRLLLSITLILVLALPVLAVIPFAGAQEGSKPVKVELTPYEGNPVLTKGAAGEWDSGLVIAGNVIYADEQYHMFYAGGRGKNPWETPHAIGYATSPDGLHWTKYTQNPVLVMDPERSQGGIPWAIPVLDGDTWVLYFNETDSPSSPSVRILRATAPAPTGPWAIDDEPVLETGGPLAWDGLQIALMSVFPYKDGFALFYVSQRPPLVISSSLGMATSPDGVTWAKFDDPATTDELLARSDPVFTVGGPGTWDAYEVTSFLVRSTGAAWELFYLGVETYPAIHNMGYAYSADGIHWTRFGDGPVLESSDEWVFGPTSLVTLPDGTYYLYVTMYSLTGAEPAIGLVTGVVTWGAVETQD